MRILLRGRSCLCLLLELGISETSRPLVVEVLVLVLVLIVGTSILQHVQVEVLLWHRLIHLLVRVQLRSLYLALLVSTSPSSALPPLHYR